MLSIPFHKRCIVPTRKPVFSAGFHSSAGVAQWLRHLPSKQRIAGSSPVTRSINIYERLLGV